MVAISFIFLIVVGVENEFTSGVEVADASKLGVIGDAIY